MKTMIRAAFLLLLALALSGCTSFQLGERYDKSIDDDLNTFQVETVTFITSMRLNAGSPQGAYTSDAAKAFYPKATATLANIKMRSGLLGGRPCPVNAIANSITLPVDGILGDLPDSRQPKTLVTGNCVEVMLLSLEKLLVDLEAAHREHQQIGAIRAQFFIQSINGSVATALSGLRAKDQLNAQR